MGPSAEVHCAARAAERVQRSRNAFSSITMTKPGAHAVAPPFILVVRAAGLGPKLGGFTSMPSVLTVLYCLISYTIERLVGR